MYIYYIYIYTCIYSSTDDRRGASSVHAAVIYVYILFFILYIYFFFYACKYTRAVYLQTKGWWLRPADRGHAVGAVGGTGGTMKTLKNHQTAKRAPKIRFYRVDYTNTIYKLCEELGLRLRHNYLFGVFIPRRTQSAQYNIYIIKYNIYIYIYTCTILYR